MRGIAGLFVCLCVVTHAGVAQQLRGVVRDSASGTPIPAVVLMLLDSSGAVVGRTITNQSGEYVAPLTSVMRRVRLLRIGFRPRVVAIPSETAGVAPFDVTMVAIPTLLNAVAVVDQPKCPRRADRMAALSLWEQAKAALLATVVARDVNPAQMMRLNTDRRMDRESDTTDRLEVRTDSAVTSRSFVASHTASAFLEHGFVNDSSTGTRTFHGPDADVLLDDAFPLGYCFELARPDRSRPHEVGLGFRPATRSSNRIDIEGVVWIDSVSRSLTDIEFRYVGLDPRYSRYGAGGRVSFRSMTDGTSIVDRWHIRLLTVLTDTSANSPARRDRVEVHERGGEVAHARWPDGREWNAALGAIAGVAEYGDGLAAHARLRLLNTDYEVVTDSAGGFRIPDLVPGPYVVEVVDSILTPLGLTLRTPVTFSAVRDSVILRSVRLPTARDYIRMRCGGKNLDEGISTTGGTVTPGQALPRTTQMIVRVLAPDGTPAAGARYEVAGEFGARPWVGRTDEQGVFVLCSVDSNQGYTLIAHYREWNGSVRRTVVQRVEAIRLQLRKSEP